MRREPTPALVSFCSVVSRDDYIKPVANTPNSDDVTRYGGVDFNLLTQSTHVDRYGAAVAEAPPKEFEELITAENLARVLDQLAQKIELPCGQANYLACESHLVRDEIDFESVKAKAPGIAGGSRSAQNCLDASDDLGRCRRLYNVVVGSQGKTPDLVGVTSSSAKEQDRDVRLGSDVPA